MRALLPLMAIGLAIPAAASARTVQDEQVWLNATVMGNLPGSRIAYFVEAQPRTADGVDRVSQLLLRGGLGYRLSDAITAYAGYAHVVLPRPDADDRNEERTFLQLNWNLPANGARFLFARTRLERRRLSNGRDAGWRLRQIIRYPIPLGDPKGVRALVYAEGFVALNDTDWGARRGFDQARGFVGFEIPVAGKSTVEAGYLNQTINDPGRHVRVNHVASLSLFLRP